MNEAERRIAEHEDMIRDLVENDPLFSVFMVVEVKADEENDGRRFILVRKEDGAGIQMPEPGSG